MKDVDVLILLGSAHDESYLEGCLGVLNTTGVRFAVKVASAHRTPDRVVSTLNEYRDAKMVIAFAGHAAHLAGVIAAHVTVPVVAVPLPTSDLQGMDALLASVQMPGGVPVATMAIGKAGSKNAGCFAAQVVSLLRPEVAEKWRTFRRQQSEKVAQSSEAVEAKWQPS